MQLQEKFYQKVEPLSQQAAIVSSSHLLRRPFQILFLFQTMNSSWAHQVQRLNAVMTWTLFTCQAFSCYSSLFLLPLVLSLNPLLPSRWDLSKQTCCILSDSHWCHCYHSTQRYLSIKYNMASMVKHYLSSQIICQKRTDVPAFEILFISNNTLQEVQFKLSESCQLHSAFFEINSERSGLCIL